MQSEKTLIFIEKARKIKGDLYDYSLVDYVNAKTKVPIICKEHGIFEQTPSKHYSGQNCPKCVGKFLSEKEKIIKLKKVHGDKYIYKNLNLHNGKIDIICKEHGLFKQYYNQHLKGSGCPKCMGMNKNNESVITEFKKVHGDKYDYSLINYIKVKEKLKIICKEHGIFEQTYSKHIIGRGCPLCGGFFKYEEKDLIERFKKVHGDKYDYENINYKNLNEKISIDCPKHGNFKQKANAHLRGCGCPKCSITLSVGEKTLFKKLSLTLPSIINSYRNIKLLGQQHFDMFLEKFKIAIEYQGIQHFDSNSYFNKIVKEGKNNILILDERKRNICKVNNIKLFYFTYTKSHIPKDYPYKVYSDEQDLLNAINDYIIQQKELNKEKFGS